MSTSDKANARAETLKGKVKETAGDAVGDERMQDEGRADQARGHLRQAAEKAKTAVKDVFKPHPR